MITETTLQRWLEKLIEQRGKTDHRFKNRSNLAKTLSLSPSAFWRQVDYEGTLGLEPLLGLALLTGEPASDVLRLGKKPELAALIEQCYGPPRATEPIVHQILDELERLESQTRATVGPVVLALLRSWPPSAGQPR